MNKIIFPILIFISGHCYSQTTIVGDTNSLTLISSGIAPGNEPNEYKSDTINVDLLISENGVVKSIHALAIRKITIEKAGSHYGGDYYWYNRTDQYSYSIEKYLDVNKNPLPNIIIWQSKF